MELVTYFAKEWAVIAQAPATFFIAALLIAGAAYAAASWRFGGVIESQRAQITLLESRLSGIPGGADFEKRKGLIDTLGEYLSRGTELMSACRKYDTAPPEADADAWLNELCEYLKANLGPAYVARVNDGGSAPVGYTSQHKEHDSLYNGIRVRVYHLQEFLKELARA